MKKVREPRIKVLIQARMRVGAMWDDVRVLNLSSRGMLLQSAKPPSRGSYVEVRRGRHVIIAKVVWREAQRFGINTQDRLPVEALIEDHAPAAANESVLAAKVERRALPRSTAQSFEQSRQWARAMEFACIACVGVAAATVGFGAVQSAFAKPMLAIDAALSR